MYSNNSPISIFWFRRDLRLEDNAGLYQALKSGFPVLPVFIFDRNILERLEDKDDKRVSFIYDAITELKVELKRKGSDILVLYDYPIEAWKNILSKFNIEKAFTNHDYEPYAIIRDLEVEALLKANGVQLQTFKDQCIFEKKEIVSNTGSIYSVFTPYSSKWKEKLTEHLIQPYPSKSLFGNFLKGITCETPSPESMGFVTTATTFPKKEVIRQVVENYHLKRNFPAIPGTTRLSVHLRFGTISIRSLVIKAKELNETWLNELIWRDFYMMILFNFPHVTIGAFRKNFNRLIWRNDVSEFEAWCNGITGYPIVDAGMRELNETGFMHNRLRMITASFLTKHLLIDWRWGEAYFAKKLLDFDLSANNGGWQWAAGSGTDAAPYFRIFNPYEQTKKFDIQLEYIKKWVPEFQELTYPKPIVDHTFARNRCLDFFKNQLNT